MALNLPSSALSIVNRIKTDIQRAVAGSNPFLKNSWLGAIAAGIANRIFDFYLQLAEALRQAFPHTATGQNLIDWAGDFGITRLPAFAATGTVLFTGTAAATVPGGTELSSSDGVLYTTDVVITISATTLSVSSITRVGTVATVTTPTAHNLGSIVPVTISGAVETEYNGVKSITVTGPTTFTFDVAGSPATPATGTITASGTYGAGTVTASALGVAGNQVAGTELALTLTLSGVDSPAQVTYGALSGGYDEETEDALRARFLDRLQNPIALFNVAAITAKAKEVAGVTRVFVQPITPAVGQVTVYFTKDNEASPIPTGADVTNVKNSILTIIQATTDLADLIVAAPTAVPVDFTFTAISPDTVTMRAAITDSLTQLLGETVGVGDNLLSDAYRSAIYNTVDTDTGDRLVSFTLSAPVGDVAITSSQLATKGVVTFP